VGEIGYNTLYLICLYVTKYSFLFMFGNFSQRICGIFDKLRGKGVLTESEISSALRDMRMVFLEADVALEVIKPFMAAVKEKALGEAVLKSITPDQMIIKIIHDELICLLSHPKESLYISSVGCTIYLMVGLQGSGKTSMSGKLAELLKNQQKKVLMASLDIYRPAAQEQLSLIGKSISVDTLAIVHDEKPLTIATRALAASHAYDVLILDTAGRLHICSEMMAELVKIKEIVTPHEILFVGDALSGQDMIRVAKIFHENLNITGSAVSRVDGDSRAGAVLSLRFCTQCPIKLMGMGELPHQAMVFDAKRIADRILDKGDIVELVNRAAQSFTQKEQETHLRRMQKGLFTLDDLAQKIRQIETMGGLSSILNLLPGVHLFKEKLEDRMQKANLKKQLAIISSMTKKEKTRPEILNGQRKRRIALGSGTSVPEVNRLLQQFGQMQKAVKQMKGMIKK
jgi:signal recognition particle subunit SRP54